MCITSFPLLSSDTPLFKIIFDPCAPSPSNTAVAQNDATKEETLFWLNNYGEKLIVSYPGFNYDKEVEFKIRAHSPMSP